MKIRKNAHVPEFPRSSPNSPEWKRAWPKSSQCLEPCATIRDTQREIWQMAILTSLFDFNEFIRYLALMGGPAGGGAGAGPQQMKSAD